MKNLVQNFKKIIFSQRCPICNEEVSGKYYLCDSCYIRLRKKSKLKNQGNFYYCFYYDEDIKKVIADFKLNNRKNLGMEIASIIKRNLLFLIEAKKIDVVIPVPISKKRMNERGFNQVEVLLDCCHVKYEKIYREKDTEHMYKFLNVKERERNIKNVFKNKNLVIDNKNILIVDDIVTTGTTIKEIIKELCKSSIPKETYIFSIAISKIFKME